MLCYMTTFFFHSSSESPSLEYPPVVPLVLATAKLFTPGTELHGRGGTDEIIVGLVRELVEPEPVLAAPTLLEQLLVLNGATELCL